MGQVVGTIACSAALLLFAAAAQAQGSYATSFEAPQFTTGSVLAQNDWGHLSNSPTGGTVEPIPAGAPAALGAQALAIRMRNVDFLGVANHLFSPIIDPPAGEPGATVEGVVAADPGNHFVASFWYRMPTAPLVSTRADGRFAELNPSSKGAGATVPANRYAQVRLFNSTNGADGLVRVETGWYAPDFTVATVADGLAWGEWYRFEYAIHAVAGTAPDGEGGALANDLFTLRIFDRDGVLVSASNPGTCGSTWELPWRAGAFGGSASPRGINGFDFWAVTGPNDTVVGHLDDFSIQSLSQPAPTLQLVSGDAQQGAPASTLEDPLVVQAAGTVADQARCHPVGFAITSSPAGAAGQALGATDVTPDADTGLAATSFTFGDQPGAYEVTATAASLAGAPQVFTLQAVVTPPSADLALDKQDGGVSFVPGGRIDYRITVTNLGPDDAADVVVEDVLPSGTTLAEVTATGWSCNAAAGTLTCTRPTLAATATAVIDLGIDVPADSNAASLRNEASVSSATADPEGGNDSDAVTTDAALAGGSADLVLAKTVDRTTAAPGDALTYTLQVDNVGTSTALDVQLADATPAGTSFLDASAPCIAGFPCALGDIAAGGQRVVTVRFLVDPGHAGGTVSNTAVASAATPDPTPADNTDSVVATVTGGAAPPAPNPAPMLVPVSGPLPLAVLVLALLLVGWRARRSGG